MESGLSNHGMRAFFRYSFWITVFLLACHSVAAEDSYPAKSWSKQESVESSAWKPEKLKAADEIAASLRTDSYLVVHRATLVHEYGDITKPRNIYSMRKSVLSVLMGMYVERGLVDLDQSLVSLQFDDINGLTEQEKSATVRQLLQARSGVYHDAAYETSAMKELRPARGSHPPGSFWYYNNWDFNALGGIFQQRVGKTVFDALRDDLATPLQFEDFRFSRDTEFVLESASKYPAYVMKLSARDLARIGLLMARNGQWAGRQLVSAKWIAESTAVYTTVPPGWLGYAYMWWVPQKAWRFWTRSDGDVFFAWGNGGQFLFVDRGRDLVIVHQVDLPKFFSKEVGPDSISKLLVEILAAAPEK